MGLTEEDLAAVKQFKLKALALQLVYIVRASNSSALALCDHFLEQVEDTQRFVQLHSYRHIYKCYYFNKSASVISGCKLTSDPDEVDGVGCKSPINQHFQVL